MCCAVLSRSVMSDSATPWTVAHQAPLSMGFSRWEYWSGCPCLFQGIFPTQRLNPRLLHHRHILYCLRHQDSPRILEWVAYPFSRGTCWPRNQTGVSWIVGRFFTSWVTQEAQLYHQFSSVQLFSCVWLFATPGIVFLCHQCCVFPDNLIFFYLYSRFVFHHCFLSVSSPHVGFVSCAVIWRYSQMFSPDTVNVCYQ